MVGVMLGKLTYIAHMHVRHKILILSYIIYVLIAVTCDHLPIQLSYGKAIVVSGSQDRPPIVGQFITYICPPGFTLTGPNASVCTGNREWEPDPGQVDCVGNATIITAHVQYINNCTYIMS